MGFYCFGFIGAREGCARGAGYLGSAFFLS
jgi:hypothetical protein